eukprot:TRINITY_DN57549_c0_g1_i1.p1 TRINITY_DN57549_c0_g1~~TRINITY_DN57549_c0_g1_i1.p1  ORF type:complete len:1191 (+),score=165.92 TRINITY_DN57549_c0_g1_i1:248-3574(+)
MAKGDAAAAAPLLEAAATSKGGEASARCLAAQAYLQAAIAQFEAFTAARQQFASTGMKTGTTGAMPGPPTLTRALSDNGVSALVACESAASRALSVAASALEDVKSSGAAEQVEERLAQLSRVAEQVLAQVNLIREMDVSIRDSCDTRESDEQLSEASRSRLLLIPSSTSCGAESKEVEEEAEQEEEELDHDVIDQETKEQAAGLSDAVGERAISSGTAAPAPEKVKSKLDMELERAFASLKETEVSVREARECVDSTHAQLQQAAKDIADAEQALEKKMDKARDLLDQATLQMAASLGDKASLDSLRKRAAAVPPPPKPKASWQRPDAVARREAARANKEKNIPQWYRPCESYRPIAIPEVGEWLAEHKESGQSFKSWERVSMKVRPHGHVNVIEIVLIGPWPLNAPPLEALTRYCEAFFMGCKVRIAEQAFPISSFAARSRCGIEGQLQICINDAMEALCKRRPARDVLCSVAITMADIYPIKNGVAWNFVFGQASLVDGVGIFSFSRFYPSGNFPLQWTGQDVATGAYDAGTDGEGMDAVGLSNMLRSSCKVLTHEIGHIFGIRHCIYYECLMCGSNNLEEGEKKPAFLCPVDLRKLQSACGFDVEERYRALASLCDEFGWKDDSAWIRQRLGQTDIAELDAQPDMSQISLARAISHTENQAELSPAEVESIQQAATSQEEEQGFANAAVAGSQSAANSDPASTADRQLICNRLREVEFVENDHELFMHGRGYQGKKLPPNITWNSTEKPRDDHDCPSWLRASEFADEPEVLKDKIKTLARLLRCSRRTVLYTGAGISASVVGQAAKSGQNTVGWKANPLYGKPTLTHYALAILSSKGLIHGWVQQNHDGLPQKAGFPQGQINEIHGSWFDPSNPVVKYCGSLHRRAFPWMQDDAQTADLVLVLGTSLGGLNADQVATNVAERSLLPGGGALGAVCINLQQTPQDGKMTLRIFAKTDAVFQGVLMELGFGKVNPRPPMWPQVSKALVPYDMDGQLLPVDAQKWMWLDLQDRAKVRITPGHNIQGAKQPKFMHIGAAQTVTYQGKKRKPAVGLGTVLRREENHFLLQVEGEAMNLGVWWLVAAMNGSVPALPVVNQRPLYGERPAT